MYRLPPINNKAALVTLNQMYQMLQQQYVQYNGLVQYYEKMMNVNYMRSTEMQEAMKSAHHKLEALRQENEKLCKLRKEYETMEAILRNQLKKLESDHLEQVDQIKDYKEINFRLRQKNEQLKAEAQKDRRYIRQLNQTVDKLNVIGNKKMVDASDDEEIKLQLEQGVKNMAKEIKYVTGARMEEISTRDAEIKELKSEIAELQRKLTERTSIIHTSSSDVDHTKEGYKETRHQEVYDATRSKDKQEKSNNQMNERELCHELELKKAEIEKIEEQHLQLKVKYAKLQEELKVAKTEKQKELLLKEELIKQNVHYKSQNEQYAERVKGLQNEITQKASLQWQLVLENKKLAEQIEAANNQPMSGLVGMSKEKVQHEELQDQLHQENRERMKVEKQLKQLKKENHRLDQLQKDARRQVDELSERLATEMHDKVSKDERNLENVSIASRPMNIASEYQAICSNQWLEAKTVVDDVLPGISEVRKLQFLSDIYMISMKQATSSFQILLARLQDFVAIPFGSETLYGERVNIIRHKDTEEKMESFFIDLLRINADKTDITSLYQTVHQAIALNFPDFQRMLQNEVVQRFIQVVTRLTWKMAIQKPPMEFSQPGLGEPWKGDQIQVAHYGSTDPNSPRSKVTCYVHPLLLHGDAVMAKGTVLLQLQ